MYPITDKEVREAFECARIEYGERDVSELTTAYTSAPSSPGTLIEKATLNDRELTVAAISIYLLVPVLYPEVTNEEDRAQHCAVYLTIMCGMHARRQDVRKVWLSCNRDTRAFAGALREILWKNTPHMVIRNGY